MPTEDELRRAIDRAQLLVHYQPKCALSDGRWAVVGVEGLIRWQHPDLGLVYPDAFIPLAEKTGLIAALTDFVLQEGIGQLGLWRAQGTELDLSVNLSPQLVRELDFPDRLSEHDARARARQLAPDARDHRDRGARGPGADARHPDAAARQELRAVARRLRHRLLVADAAVPDAVQ